MVFYNKQQTGWIELKEVRYTWTTSIISIPFRPGQLAWMLNYSKYNNSVYLIGTIRHEKNSWFIVQAPNIRRGYSVSELKIGSLTNINLNLLF